jgi:hypothetical protein
MIACVISNHAPQVKQTVSPTRAERGNMAKSFFSGVGFSLTIMFVVAIIYVFVTDGSVCIVRPDWFSKLLGAG